MEFVKMEGLGNDFVVLGGPLRPTAAQVGAWCDRRRGIGADGVLVVSPRDGGRVRMDYWNADGGRAEMCGNGLRCAARYARERGWTPGSGFVVETAVGERPVEVLEGERVRAFLGAPQPPEVEELEVAGVRVRPMGMGNPHAVVLVEDPARVPVEELGPRIGTDPTFPEGANVEFAAVRAEDLLELRVWERGVGETLACGSGAAAAAAVGHRLGRTGEQITVRLLGGDLQVEIAPEGVWIEGPARYVFSGVWYGRE